MNEFEIINNYFRKLATSKASLNLNDDIFFDKKNKLAVTVDTYNEDVHFLNFDKSGPKTITPALIVLNNLYGAVVFNFL